ncbi:MAG: MmgE/PrpD family protein [Theionarchaea archaeon]|nr:MmgE/PrpD family protein [Theionarchaea archaeon]
MKFITEELGEYITYLKYSDLPDEVVLQAKRILLDTLGCIIGAYETRLGHTFIESIKGIHGEKKATMVGDPEKHLWIFAAMANSYLADLLDFEQTLTGHESSVVIPAALAAGEACGKNGEDVITAIVAGYEVQTRVGLAISPSRSRFKEVSSPSVEICSSFGAGSAAGKLFGFSSGLMNRTLNAAGTLSPILTMYKFLERPASLLKGKYWWCAYAGCFAVHLVQNGLHGPRDILGGDHGYWICCGSDQCDFGAFTRELGTSFMIMGDSFKPYPSCRWTHPALDAVQILVLQHDLNEKTIRQIRVKSSSVIKDFRLDDPIPESIVDAEFSLPYAIAMIVKRVSPGLDWYPGGNVSLKNGVRELCEKVKIETDPDLDMRYFEEKTERANPAYVEIETVDGTVFSHAVTCPRGDPTNPLSDSELEEKFTGLCRKRFSEQKIQDLIDSIWNVENTDNISRLMDKVRSAYNSTG